MDYKKYTYVFVFIFIISLLVLPIPLYYELCGRFGGDYRCHDKVWFFSGVNYFFHKWIGEEFNVNEFHIPIWFVSNSIIALLITSIIINWDKQNGRFYSIFGVFFLILFVLLISLSALRIFRGIDYDLEYFLIFFGNPVLLILSIIFGQIAKKKGDNKLGSKVFILGISFFILNLLILMMASAPGLG